MGRKKKREFDSRLAYHRYAGRVETLLTIANTGNVPPLTLTNLETLITRFEERLISYESFSNEINDQTQKVIKHLLQNYDKQLVSSLDLVQLVHAVTLEKMSESDRQKFIKKMMLRYSPLLRYSNLPKVTKTGRAIYAIKDIAMYKRISDHKIRIRYADERS